jgi:DNA-binding NarL/FixJ family response regulator
METQWSRRTPVAGVALVVQDSLPGVDRLERGRAAFEKHQWATAYAELSAADLETPLEPEDLDHVAMCADLTGHTVQCFEYWTRAHHGFLDRGDIRRGVYCAFWVGMCYFFQGGRARANGWFARVQRLLDEAGLDSVYRGYLLVPQALQTYWGGDVAGGHALFSQAADAAKRFQEPDLQVVSAIGLGETFVHLGEASRGFALVDEAMATVLAGEVSPLMVGLAYCAAVSAYQQFFETRRAQEWTRAFSDWCESQEGLVPFRGECLVHRAELMQLRGSWPDAMQEVERACQGLSDPYNNSWAGAAFYQQGEVHRLRGEFAQAEEAYRQASQWGRTPQPGLALLRLALGRPSAAVSALARALAETQERIPRSRLLPAQVEVALAVADVETARSAADELNAMAESLDVPLLHALAATATGAVVLADGDPARALGLLRKALGIWHALEAPYEAARARTLIAAACSQLGDEDGATLEIDAAVRVFRSLGAAPDLERYAAHGPTGPGPAGLTQREIEVLKLVVAGKTNHAIAQELFLSDHTVRRHLQNVFAKLGVSSRAAATAFALQNDLI